MLNLSDTEVAWLAGLLEGEGSFSITHDSNPTRRPQVRVSLTMSDKDVVQRACDLMGWTGRLRVRHDTRSAMFSDTYQFHVYGDKAFEVMRLVRPYMGQRRGAKIDEILARTDLSHMPRNTTKGVTLSA